MRFLLAVCLLAVPACCLQLVNTFGNHMVLQRDREVILWGMDNPGSHITATCAGKPLNPTQTNGQGLWATLIPPTPASQVPVNITIISSAGGHIQLFDILFGDVYVCSGQSNMELTVMENSYYQTALNAADGFGPRLRIMQVQTVAEYSEVTTPQNNFQVSIPWSRAGAATIGGMSALCYYYGTEYLNSQPTVPVGLIASSWGGTTIEVWMPPDALKACGEGRRKEDEVPNFVNPDPGLGYLRNAENLASALDIAPPPFPTAGSCLWYSMLYPLTLTPITGILWYQGESNAANPTGYERCFPAMITSWRETWYARTGKQVDPQIPFLFVQISSWPAGDIGLIAGIRYAQLAALTLPKVGMTVAADIGDPSGAVHPIHPPWKQEVARRTWLVAQNIIYGNASVPVQGPTIASVIQDVWEPSWGNYHYGYGGINVCQVVGWTCCGIRIKFNQPVSIRPTYGLIYGFVNGFDLLVSSGLWVPVTLGDVLPDGMTIQLNVTIAPGVPVTLRYGWHDYPTMPLVNSWGQPVPPFNISVPKP